MASSSDKELTTFRLPPELKARMRREAEAKGLTLTAAVEQAMALWLACGGIPDVDSILNPGGAQR